MALKIVTFSLFFLSLSAGAWCASNTTITLKCNRSTKLLSPNWPSYYDNGSAGRYIIQAPAFTQITAKCSIDMFDPSPNQACASERFYVFTGGSFDYSTAEVLCGIQEFTRISTDNQLRMAYVSVRYSGKFSCDLIAKPISLITILT
ncbi:uncharacterized protein LOC119068889 [Bradysia coprophila]|uniref:uncharacterized protein LOC119068889 n=1 Tax=Bradysia coprophila TaxID=38358 RepID=UPI00187DBC16|nr:uncharacterized protein LOC119068889 [Bradysia coprophila]